MAWRRLSRGSLLRPGLLLERVLDGRPEAHGPTFRPRLCECRLVELASGDGQVALAVGTERRRPRSAYRFAQGCRRAEEPRRPRRLCPKDGNFRRPLQAPGDPPLVFHVLEERQGLLVQLPGRRGITIVQVN